ncbi:MAG: hypothetical protein C4558_00255 [Dehalococcoidia bacterium]|nr:MAG: hypothetical protein C4558_00255 [Dehalococcoidia bacterium]
MRLAFVAGIMLLAACSASGPESALPPTHRLTPDEVTRLFSEWACPGRPSLASVLVRLSPVAVDPESQPQSQGGRWIVLTSVGSVSFRESTRIFEPSEQASRAILDLQEADGCRP